MSKSRKNGFRSRTHTYPFVVVVVVIVVVVVVVVVVVLTLTHRRNTMQSVVTGQAPITLEWKNYVGK